MSTFLSFRFYHFSLIVEFITTALRMVIIPPLDDRQYGSNYADYYTKHVQPGIHFCTPLRKKRALFRFFSLLAEASYIDLEETVKKRVFFAMKDD